MKTVIVTDCKYRMSIAAIRALGKAGFRVIGTQTQRESDGDVPAFSSRYMDRHYFLEGSVNDPEYKDRLLALIQQYEHPALLCIGAVTLNTVSRFANAFSPFCDFLIAEPAVLDALNDKECVHQRAEELGLCVPKQYAGLPDEYPVVVKPHCGEKFGLSAGERYAVAHNREQCAAILEKMKQYDPAPLIQQKIEGQGKGACLLIGKDGQLINAVCHKRIREYPIAGGPSTCCESFYDEKLIADAYALLSSFGFIGMAMVEFKGDAILEVNPRIWGSFPMTECCGSTFTYDYVCAACGEPVAYRPGHYQRACRMRFLLNDTLSILKHLSKGHFKIALSGVLDTFRAREALFARNDWRPFLNYLRKSLCQR